MAVAEEQIRQDLFQKAIFPVLRMSIPLRPSKVFIVSL